MLVSKYNLAMGFGLFLLVTIALLGMMALGLVIDTAFIASILFLFNAAFHWCGGWAYAGLWKTLSYGFGIAVVVRVFKILHLVVK